MFSFLEKYSVIAINLVMMAVVSRLLTPAEIGIFMVGTAVVMMTEAFRNFGVTVYLIQERELTREGVRTAFTVSFLLSLVFAAGLYVSSGPIAVFFGEAGLESVLCFAAIGCLLIPFSAPIMALLQRDMAFDRLAVINVVVAAVNFITVVALAGLGFGYMSLAWAGLVAGAAGVALALAYRPQLWLFMPAFTEWRKVLSFGGYSSATALLNVFYQQLPQLLLGRILTFGAVGLYGRSLMLCQIFDRFVLSAVGPVVLPALSERVRNGDELKEPYLRAIGHMTAVQWPFLVCLALLADPIVHVVLGPQWLEAIPLVRLIALASLCMFAAFMTYPVLVSVGRIEDTLWSSLISLLPSVAVVYGAAHVSLEAVAASMFVTAPFQVYVALRFIRRHVPFSWSELALSTAKSALVTLFAAASPATMVAFIGLDLSIPAAIAAALAAAAGWGAGLAVTGHPLLAEVRNVLHQAGSMLRIYHSRRVPGTAAQ
jgi:O-antigen/teichoic acid export membrane protein